MTGTLGMMKRKAPVATGNSLFDVGYAIGNAYGDMWANNAKNRQTKRFDEYLDQLKYQNEIQDVAELRETGINQLQPEYQKQAIEEVTKEVPRLSYDGIGVQKNDNYKFKNNIEAYFNNEPTAKEKAINDIIALNSTARAINTEQQAKMSPEQRSQYVFNPNYNEENIRAWARKNGINDEIIEERMPTIKQDISQKAQAALLPAIERNLYGYVDADGKAVPATIDTMVAALGQLRELEKYAPEVAAAYRAQVPTPKERYHEAAAANAYAQKQAARRTERLEDMNFKMALANSRGRSQRGNSYSVSDGTYKMAVDRMKEIEQLVEENGGKTTPELVEEYEAMNSLKKGWMAERVGYKPQQPTKQAVTNTAPAKAEDISAQVQKIFAPYDKNNADWSLLEPGGDGREKGAFQQAIDIMRQNGVKEETIQKHMLSIANNLWGSDSDYYEALQHSFGLKSQKDFEREKLKEEEREAQRVNDIRNTKFSGRYGIDPSAAFWKVVNPGKYGSFSDAGRK